MMILDLISNLFCTGQPVNPASCNYTAHIADVVNSEQFSAKVSEYGNEWIFLGRDLGLWSLLTCFITLVTVLILWQIFKKIPARARDASLKWWFILIWIFGFVVYDIGMCTGERISLLTNAPMAIVHAFGIFILDSDVSAIHEHFHNSWIYMMFFSLVHILAAIVSTLFVINHFRFNILARWRMFKTRYGGKTDETYVFWGLNEASFQLINSIKKHYGNDNKNYRIIVVRTNKDGDDSPESRTGVGRIFDFLSLRNSELERLQELGCLTAGTYTDLSAFNPNDMPDGPNDIIGHVLNLKSLQKILANKTRRKIHMLFLSNEEKDNLHAVELLRGDKTINEFPCKPNDANPDSSCNINHSDTSTDHQVIFYCHARYNSVHRVVEDQNSSDGITVKVIDSSHINVEMLKRNNDMLPVNFVDVEANATVSSPFNALVVGFSEVGQDSARFLYEFGAFVKSGSNDQHVARSEFHMHIVDNNMADLAGIFVANAPAIKPSTPFISGSENPDATITLHDMDCRSIRFYHHLEKWITDLNYIVIATDNDELNISLGVRIFKIATRYRKNLEKFCILVRVHNDDDGNIRKIAGHYNRLWAAQIAAGKNTTLNQKTIKRDAPVNKPIYLFGLDKETYTYGNVIDDNLEKQAIEFKELYEASSNPDEHKYATKESEKAWVKDYREKMQLDGEYKPYHPTYSALMKLRRTQGQDFANCLHSETKRLLAQKALTRLGIPSFAWGDLLRKDKTTVYTLKSGEAINPGIIRILNVLAQTEHLRWIASHEILGYICVGQPKDKDEVKLHHGCITAWENLDEKTQSYDYNVVDVTLNIINPQKPISS